VICEIEQIVFFKKVGLKLHVAVGRQRVVRLSREVKLENWEASDIVVVHGTLHKVVLAS